MWSGWMAPSRGEFGGERFWDFDVSEDDKEVVVRAEMPGFDEKNLDVQLHNDVLTIKAEKEQKGEGEEQYRRFFRSVTLPPGVEADKAQASYRNGVLEMHFPRSEQAQGRRIPIQGSPPAGRTAEAQSPQAAKHNGPEAASKGKQAAKK
jgi:HSP20 family molecular chaperone IbpA